LSYFPETSILLIIVFVTLWTVYSFKSNVPHIDEYAYYGWIQSTFYLDIIICAVAALLTVFELLLFLRSKAQS